MSLEFEFIQVAIGNRKSLSGSVTDVDWLRLFEFCKRQAVLGIGFAAVERLYKVGVECPSAIRLKWVG